MSQILCCWHCGESVDDVPRPFSRHANCDHCLEELHCCRMCRHFNPDQRPYCDHDFADPPEVKENANFCEYFKPANRYQGSAVSSAATARSELDALFGDDQVSEDAPAAGEGGTAQDAKNKLDGLFDD